MFADSWNFAESFAEVTLGSDYRVDFLVVGEETPSRPAAKWTGARINRGHVDAAELRSAKRIAWGVHRDEHLDRRRDWPWIDKAPYNHRYNRKADSAH